MSTKMMMKTMMQMTMMPAVGKMYVDGCSCVLQLAGFWVQKSVLWGRGAIVTYNYEDGFWWVLRDGPGGEIGSERDGAEYVGGIRRWAVWMVVSAEEG